MVATRPILAAYVGASCSRCAESGPTIDSVPRDHRGVLGYGYLRALPSHAGVQHERNVLPAIDRVLGGGATPGQRLQSLFFAGHATSFDVFWTVVYTAWFVVPSLLTLYVVVFKWHLIGTYAPVRLSIYFLPLVVYLLMPTDPPWMTVHEVRIMPLVTGFVPNDGNPSAAFPSMHVLTPATLALWLCWKRVNVMAAVFSAYTVLTVFAVLYLGEHYLVDVLASLCIAVAIVWTASRPEPKVVAMLRTHAAFGPQRAEIDAAPVFAVANMSTD